MKKDIHPVYLETLIRCSCGNEINTRSTRPDMQFVDTCSNCHAYFTGVSKVVNRGSRIERFKQKYQHAS